MITCLGQILWIEGTLLKFTLNPKEDELLTSWVARYALSFGLTPYSFLKYAFDCPKVSILDYDRFISSEYKKKFAENSGLNEIKIESQTIVEHFKNCIDISSKQPYNLYKEILPKSKSKVSGLMYCPLCLKEDPYFKINWRHSFNIGCPIHKVRLKNKCPHCNEPIRLELLNSFLRDVSYCFSCWRSLTTQQNIQTLNKESYWLTLKIHEAVSYGSVAINESLMSFSPLWFNGIWVIINVLYSKKKSINFFRSICEYYGISTKLKLSESRNFKRFGSENLEVRYLVLRLVALMIKDWPKSFVSVCKTIGITKSVLNPHGIILPYWLHEVCNKELHTFHYRVTDEEIKSVLDYQLYHDINITRSGLARMLGNDESMKLNSIRITILKQYQKKQKALKQMKVRICTCLII